MSREPAYAEMEEAPGLIPDIHGRDDRNRTSGCVNIGRIPPLSHRLHRRRLEQWPSSPDYFEGDLPV